SSVPKAAHSSALQDAGAPVRDGLLVAMRAKNRKEIFNEPNQRPQTLCPAGAFAPGWNSLARRVAGRRGAAGRAAAAVAERHQPGQTRVGASRLRASRPR